MHSFIRLAGQSSTLHEAPLNCKQCASAHLYLTPDFRRSLGLWMVSIASIATVILLAQGYGWWTVWSPMFIALIIDRSFNWLTPLVVVCYECEHIHRGLNRDEVLNTYMGFDLELHDRLQIKSQAQSK